MFHQVFICKSTQGVDDSLMVPEGLTLGLEENNVNPNITQIIPKQENISSEETKMGFIQPEEIKMAIDEARTENVTVINNQITMKTDTDIKLDLETQNSFNVIPYNDNTISPVSQGGQTFLQAVPAPVIDPLQTIITKNEAITSVNCVAEKGTSVTEIKSENIDDVEIKTEDEPMDLYSEPGESEDVKVQIHADKFQEANENSLNLLQKTRAEKEKNKAPNMFSKGGHSDSNMHKNNTKSKLWHGKKLTGIDDDELRAMYNIEECFVLVNNSKFELIKVESIQDSYSEKKIKPYLNKNPSPNRIEDEYTNDDNKETSPNRIEDECTNDDMSSESDWEEEYFGKLLKSNTKNRSKKEIRFSADVQSKTCDFQSEQNNEPCSKRRFEKQIRPTKEDPINVKCGIFKQSISNDNLGGSDRSFEDELKASENSLNCNKCNTCFELEGGLKCHLNSSCGEQKQEAKCQCNICEKHFTTMKIREAHKNTHTNDHPSKSFQAGTKIEELETNKNEKYTIKNNRSVTNTALKQKGRVDYCQESQINIVNLKTKKWRKILPKRTVVPDSPFYSESTSKDSPGNSKDNENSSESDPGLNEDSSFNHCTKCGKYFETLKKYNQHMSYSLCNGYRREAKYKCSICDKVFPSRDKKEYHENSHTNARPFKCSDCDKCFNSKTARHMHYKNMHLYKKKDRFLCCFCAYTTESREDLSAHEESHALPEGAEIPKPFNCVQCGKGYISKWKLKRHKREHKLKKCDKCSEIFKSDTQLRNHMEAKHGIVKTCICEKCGKQLKNAKKLKKHEECHSASLSFFCDICDKGFKRKNNLKQHMITHSDERPICCPECGERFKRPTHLKQHVDACHGTGRK